MSGQIKPPFAYYGGKTTLAPKIADLLPAHDHYVEPFAGSLAVLLAKKPSRAETVNDLDGDLITFWRVLRDRPEELVRACELTPHSRAEFASSWDELPEDDIEKARRVWVRLTQSRGKSMKPTGWWNSLGSARNIPGFLRSFSERIGPCAERLAEISIESRDALDLIRDYGTEPSVCIYADPPYVGSTRHAGKYAREMTEDSQHEQFAQACNDAKASLVISGYGSALYDSLFPDWHRVELKATTRLSGTTAQPEVIWSNVPLGQQEAFDLDITA